MNTEELIEIARECAEKYSIYGITNAFIKFDDAGLHEFIKRIEQSHKQRIAELEKQIAQLREALEDVLWDQTHENMEKARKALEESQ